MQVPSPTVKSVALEPLNGVAVKTTGPPEAVKVIAPVQVDVDPALTAGQEIAPVAASAPLAPVPFKVYVVPVPLEGLTVMVALCAPVDVGVNL